jgi:hypothetical protein
MRDNCLELLYNALQSRHNIISFHINGGNISDEDAEYYSKIMINNISDEGAEYYCKIMINNNTELISASLYGDKTDKGVTYLTNAITQCINLSIICLSFASDTITDNAMDNIGNAIKTHPKLTTIYIQYYDGLASDGENAGQNAK